MQEDTIFVSGMADDASEDDVKDHFGSIGIIKVRRKRLEDTRYDDIHIFFFPWLEMIN